MRIAAIGDLHCTAKSSGAFGGLMADILPVADVLLLAGDLTDIGVADEARILAEELQPVLAAMPVVAVLGNHDFESGHAPVIRAILEGAGVVVLDGEAKIIGDVGIAGVKGFGGGFGRAQLTAFGEDAIKVFVQESVQESRKLETALAGLQVAHRLVLTHYGPIRDTVLPEAAELHPFLGSSHLEDVVDKNDVRAVFHGHAHYGTPEGATRAGVAVYNVALPVLRRHCSGPPIRVLSL